MLTPPSPRAAGPLRSRRTGVGLLAVLGLLGCGVAACSAAPRGPRIPVAVVADVALAPDAVAGLALTPVALPARAAPPAVDLADATAGQARKAYGAGDWAGCLAALRGRDLAEVLAAGQRASASRLLAFEIACQYEVSRADARTAAARFASLRLDLPADHLPAEVEALIASARERAGGEPVRPIAVDGSPGARLAVDGRAGVCALPCTIDLPAGEHVLAVDADGFAPLHRVIRVPATSRVSLAQPAAPRELATQQWQARQARGLTALDATAARLLGRLATEVVVLRAGTGALVRDGTLRAQLDGTAPAPLVRDLAYAGGLLSRPRAWQRPWFWIAATGVALAAAGAIVWVVYEPDTRTEVHF